MKTKCLLAAIIFLAIACSSKKTQRELYEETTASFTYKTYKATSAATVGPAIKIYNAELPDSITPLKSEYAHLLLGYLWTVSKKPSMAFAEADLAQESTDDDVRYMAQSLRAITMYEQGWDTLARTESQQAKDHLHKPHSTIQYEATTFYILLGIAKIYDKDLEGSKFYWAGFANETGIHWPYLLTDAVADIQAKRIQQGLQKFKVLSQDPAVPEALRTVLVEKIALIEQKGGDVDSPLFWPRLISTVVLEELKKSSDSQLSRFVNMLEGLRKKLPA
ncbi:MAG TPA: hypothetical protein VIN08_13255 [Ohtaekwangia sp.]|uniref:hypothetical protein n=1 Tax=Ohtaekwangia sp. TaxID=2066019 RepID=UPI002F952BA7